MIPSRDRPDDLREATESVRATSTLADVVAYVDDDQCSLYVPGYSMPEIVFGPRIGPVAAANEIVKKYPEYDAYGLITDDSRLNIPGWDEWFFEMVNHFPHRICVVSPCHNLGEHVDMPFVTREWIDVVGWFAYPKNFHYMWPTITGLIGEMTALVHAPYDRFGIQHFAHPHTNLDRWKSDAEAFYEFVALELPKTVEKVRQAMAA